MASSVGDEKRIVESITAGAMDFILKPLNHARVKKAVLNVISMFRIETVAVDKIEEGTRCARDVMAANNTVILPANTTIEMKHAPLLQAAGVKELELIIPRDIKSLESRVEDDLRFMRGLFANKRALIVDDSKLMRHKLWKIFRDMGFGAITQTENGREGVEAAFKTFPDIITMDIEMPELDGVRAMQIITEKLPESRVIMISSVGEEDRIIQCMASGARDFILKPLNDIRVKSAVLNAL
jgi:two-component system chemotaxis response regulator CheY